MQERRNYIANTLELHLSCTNPSIFMQMWSLIFALHFFLINPCKDYLQLSVPLPHAFLERERHMCVACQWQWSELPAGGLALGASWLLAPTAAITTLQLNQHIKYSNIKENIILLFIWDLKSIPPSLILVMWSWVHAPCCVVCMRCCM